MKNLAKTLVGLTLAAHVRGHCAISSPLFTTATIQNGGQNECTGAGGIAASGNRIATEHACYINNPPSPRPQFTPGQTFSFDAVCNNHNSFGFTFVGVDTNGNIDNSAPPASTFDQTFTPSEGGNILGGAGGIQLGMMGGRGSQDPLAMPGTNNIDVTLPNDMPLGRAFIELWTVEAQTEVTNPADSVCCGGGDWFSTTVLDVCGSNTIQDCPVNTCTVLQNGNGLGVQNGAEACDDDVLCIPPNGVGQCNQNGMINGICSDGMCECTPDADPCGNSICGMVNDGCGNLVSCGDCMDPTPFCNAGTCTATECIPDTDCLDAAGDPQCALISDGCEGSVMCETPMQCTGDFDTCGSENRCINAQGLTPSEAIPTDQSSSSSNSSASVLAFSATFLSFLTFLLF